MIDRLPSLGHATTGIALLVLIAAADRVAGIENWTSYRGPTDQGRADEAKLPLEWSEDENVVWKTRVNGKAWSSPVIWKRKRTVPRRPSVLLDRDLLFMVDDSGIGACVEAETGNEVWRKRIGGNFSSSPIYADGRVYFFDQDGTATVVKAGREFEVLAVNQLDDGFMASPAVSGDALFLRTRTHLYRIEQENGEAARF